RFILNRLPRLSPAPALARLSCRADVRNIPCPAPSTTAMSTPMSRDGSFLRIGRRNLSRCVPNAEWARSGTLGVRTLATGEADEQKEEWRSGRPAARAGDRVRRRAQRLRVDDPDRRPAGGAAAVRWPDGARRGQRYAERGRSRRGRIPAR